TKTAKEAIGTTLAGLNVRTLDRLENEIDSRGATSEGVLHDLRKVLEETKLTQEEIARARAKTEGEAWTVKEAVQFFQNHSAGELIALAQAGQLKPMVMAFDSAVLEDPALKASFDRLV